MKALSLCGSTLQVAAAKAGVSENTARKYVRLGQPPSKVRQPHTWRTHEDAFGQYWDEITALLVREPGLEAKTIFEYLQERYPGCLSDGQLRGLQRRVKTWRATHGPGKEVFFEQVHRPGDIGESDFTHGKRLGVTIAGAAFDHLLYHFVLTFSNWEYAQICFSESLQSLSEGLQAALWFLGGVPKRHRTDSLSAAVRNDGVNRDVREDFTHRYDALVRHYGMEPEHTQPSSPNENGDVEQSHYRFFERIEQALMLRGSREFASREQYQDFLRQHCEKANRQRLGRITQERGHLRDLPAQGYDAAKRLVVRVSAGSTIRVSDSVYSVHSRLIGEHVHVTVRSETIDVSYGQTVIARMPRMSGKKDSSIDYRHVIDSLVKKPGAFDNYIYKPALFPSARFRMAYDALVEARPVKGRKEYLLILQHAARSGQVGVDEAIRYLQDNRLPLSERSIAALIDRGQNPPSTAPPSCIADIDLAAYDALLPTAPFQASSEVAYV